MKIGDRINVHFTSSTSLFNVEILSMPSCAGDYWLLKGTDGSVYNVMVFEQMHQFSDIIEAGQPDAQQLKAEIAALATEIESCLGCIPSGAKIFSLIAKMRQLSAV